MMRRIRWPAVFVGMAIAALTSGAVGQELPKVESLSIRPEPLNLTAGKPLSLRALTQKPTALPEALNWTVETRRHRGTMMSMTVSPDRKLVATGGIDGTIRVWDLASGSLVRAMVGHDYYIYGISWSPDGSTIASAGSHDGTVRLWNAANGMPLRVFKGHKHYVLRTAWSPDGSRLVATGGHSGWVWVYNARSDKGDIAVEIGQQVLSIQWSPNSQQLALTATLTPVSIFDLATSKVVQTLGDPQVANYIASWSPDGGKLAVGSAAQSIVYEIPSGKVLLTLPAMGYGAAWSPDGARLATATSGGATQIWDAASGRSLKAFVAAGSDLLWPAAEQLIVRGVSNLSVWNPAEAQKAYDYNIGGLQPPVWTANRPLVTGMGTTKLSLWDNTTAKALKTLEGHKSPITAISWTRDGKILATASQDKTVGLWEASSGKLAHMLTEHNAAVTCVSWSADGKTLASGGADNTVRLWNNAGKPLGALEGHKKPITDLAWSPRGNFLASGSTDTTIRLWSPDKQQLQRELSAVHPVQALAFSPDGSMLASGTTDEVVRIFLSSGKPVDKDIRSTSSSPGIYSLAWSADGSMLLTGRANHLAQLWNWQEPKIIHSVQTFAPAKYVAWTPTTSLMVTGSQDRSVRFWDGPTAELRGIILDQDDHAVMLSPDSHYRIDKAHEPDFVYIVQTPTEQRTIKPADFATKYRWRNVPAQVKFAGK